MTASPQLNSRGRGVVLAFPGIGECSLCGHHERLNRTGRCKDCAGVRIANVDSLIHPTKPWEEDDACWYIVAHHPDGLTLEEVSSVMGITRERVRQIEAKAIKKFVRSMVRLRSAGEVELDDFGDLFGWADDELEGRLARWLDAPKLRAPEASSRARPGAARKFAHAGLELTAGEWAARPEVAELGITAHLLNARIAKGWPTARALTEAKHMTNPGHQRDPRTSRPTSTPRSEERSDHQDAHAPPTSGGRRAPRNAENHGRDEAPHETEERGMGQTTNRWVGAAGEDGPDDESHDEGHEAPDGPSDVGDAPATSGDSDTCPPEGRLVFEERGGRTVTLLEYEGKTLSANGWFKEPAIKALGISAPAIKMRVDQGWSVRDALTTPKLNATGARARAKKRPKKPTAPAGATTPGMNATTPTAARSRADAPKSGQTREGTPAASAGVPAISTGTSALAARPQEPRSTATVHSFDAPLRLVCEQVEGLEEQIRALKSAANNLALAYHLELPYPEAS